MTTEQKLALLDQLAPVYKSNSELLKLAYQLPQKDGAMVAAAAEKIIEACAIINNLCEQSDNPIKEAVTW